jgi:hypothetical protein
MRNMMTGRSRLETPNDQHDLTEVFEANLGKLITELEQGIFVCTMSSAMSISLQIVEQANCRNLGQHV